MLNYYHASNIKGIQILEPRISNHNVPLIYFSDKRENVLVYLSNAVEKVCREAHFEYSGIWHKWGSYGFEKDGRLRFEEYYPNALEDTYRGVQGYIYSCSQITPYREIDIKIPNVHISAQRTEVHSCEFVPDAYNELLKAECEGKITILRYKEFITNEKRQEWLGKVIAEEYQKSESHPEYRFFLKARFGELLETSACDYSGVELETEDLILKKAEPEDWRALYHNLWKHEESAKYMLWRPKKSEEEARECMNRTVAFQKTEKYAFLVYLRKTGEPIGFAGMKDAGDGVYGETGIALGPDFVGKGYGRQIFNVLTEEAKRMGATKFVAGNRTENEASCRCQRACGFFFDHLSEEKTDPKTGEKYFLEYNVKIL